MDAGRIAAVIEKIERERFAAMTAVDRGQLERLLAASLRYCHSDGRCETKTEFIDNLVSGRMRYHSIEMLQLEARPVGPAAMLVQGRIAVDAQSEGRPARFRLVYTDVYERQRDGGWQLVAWQSTRLP